MTRCLAPANQGSVSGARNLLTAGSGDGGQAVPWDAISWTTDSTHCRPLTEKPDRHGIPDHGVTRCGAHGLSRVRPDRRVRHRPAQRITVGASGPQG